MVFMIRAFVKGDVLSYDQKKKINWKKSKKIRRPLYKITGCPSCSWPSINHDLKVTNSLIINQICVIVKANYYNWQSYIYTHVAEQHTFKLPYYYATQYMVKIQPPFSASLVNAHWWKFLSQDTYCIVLLIN